MTTENDFIKAAAESVGAYLVQQGFASGSLEQKFEQAAHKESPEKPGFAGPCDKPRRLPMEDNGLEQSASRCSDTAISSTSVQSVSHLSENTVRWDDLRALIAECPDLPIQARQSLIARGDAERK